MINFKPKKILAHLPEGEYEGSINKIDYYEDKGYFAVNILVDDKIFNTAFSVNSVVFNNFATEFVDSKGMLDETQLIDTIIRFTVKDKYSDDSKSVVTKIDAVYED